MTSLFANAGAIKMSREESHKAGRVLENCEGHHSLLLSDMEPYDVLRNLLCFFSLQLSKHHLMKLSQICV
jgi:hypothetical protein